MYPLNMPIPKAPDLASLSNWRDLPTVTTAEYAAIFRCSPAAAYRAIQRGEVPTIMVGKRKRVPTIALRRLLGEIPMDGAA